MEKKIIEFENAGSGNRTCLLCFDKPAKMKLTINRVKFNDVVTSFHICDECLAKMQKDIENRK